MDPSQLIYVNTETFESAFKIDSRTSERKMLTMMYDTLTTLSTTGLGDYKPRADEERILTTILFMSGTSLFSFIMGSFIEIVYKFQQLNKDLE
jgi:hypothetical protein